MNYQKVEFTISAANASQFARDGIPQIAFAGKSNVGKSSVINRVLQRKKMAYVGNSPGRPFTSTISWWTIPLIWWICPVMSYGKVSPIGKSPLGKAHGRLFRFGTDHAGNLDRGCAARAHGK